MESVFAIIFRYFWFVCAAFMVINTMIWRQRLAPLIEGGIVTKAEVDGFTKWAAVWLVGGPIVAALVALAAGWPSPLCAGILSFVDLPHALMGALTIVSWIGPLVGVGRQRR